MPRFAVLKHDLPADHLRESHWDLLLEDAGTLLTWAFGQWPPIDQAIATRLADHRLDYLGYEGPVSQDRGHVVRVAAGQFRTLEKSDDHLVRVLRIELDPPVNMVLSRQGDSKHWRCFLELLAQGEHADGLH